MKTFVPLVCDLVSQREINGDGFMKAPACISRAGNVQPYRAREVRGADGVSVFADRNPDDMVYLYRPPEEVFDEESLASFEDAPITDGHPDPSRYPQGVTSTNWKELAIGHVRDVKGDPKSNKVMARTCVRDEKGVQNIFQGKSQLSLGYGFDCDRTPGVTGDGQKYDGIMRTIRGNHLAIVYNARGGADCRVADQSTSEGNMKVKLTVDGLDHMVEEETASLVRSLVDKRDAAVKTLAEKEAAHGAAVTALTQDHAKEIAKIRGETIPRSEVSGLVTEQCKLLLDCGALCPDVKTDGLDALAIRRAMITDLTGKHTAAKNVCDAVLAGTALDKASEDQVKMVCNAAVASARATVQDAEARQNQIARAFAHQGGDPEKKKTSNAASADDSAEIEDLSESTIDRKMNKSWQVPSTNS